VGTVIYDETPHMSYRQHGENVVGGNRGKIAHWKKRINHFLHGKYDHYRSRLAKQLYDGYAPYISSYNQKMVKAFADAPRSFSARLRLIFSNFPETQEKSEMFLMKLFILFGLI
jgi:rhamnosyltransferase